MIVYKTAAEVEAMRASARIVAQILDELGAMIQPGLRTSDLDAYAERRARELGARPAFKGYRGYPASLCVSINEEVIHGIPSSHRILREGDIASLDFGAFAGGFYGDAARTYPVGRTSPLALRLIAAAERAFAEGVAQFVEGRRLSDISAAVQRSVEASGFSVVRSFVGHGIGQELHEEPQVPNFGFPGRGPKLHRGLVLAIEPMIAAGDWDVEILSDGWTAVTKDRGLAAHFEETVALTAAGAEVLSRRDGTSARTGGKELSYA
ncbi:MAG: type I methionyl aminopeptidase [Candidatus Aminicenantes bacterium]|nr:type I methionyl aminopeptidase [Candidatus Aminicenantes bacterium]